MTFHFKNHCSSISTIFSASRDFIILPLNPPIELVSLLVLNSYIEFYSFFMDGVHSPVFQSSWISSPLNMHLFIACTISSKSISGPHLINSIGMSTDPVAFLFFQLCKGLSNSYIESNSFPIVLRGCSFYTFSFSLLPFLIVYQVSDIFVQIAVFCIFCVQLFITCTFSFFF